MGGANSDLLIIDIVDFSAYNIPLICLILLLWNARFGNLATQWFINADAVKSATEPV